MPIKIYKDRVEISTLSTTTKLAINGAVEGLDVSKITGAASQSDLNTLEDRVDSASEAIGTLQGNYTSLGTTVGLLSNDITTLQQNYTSLSGKVDSQSKDIATLQKDLDDTQIFVLESFANGAIKLSKMSTDENNNAVFTPYEVGDINTPVYFEDGIPKQCDTSLNVNITGTASQTSGKITFSEADGYGLPTMTEFNGSENVSINLPGFYYDENTKTLNIYTNL